MASIFLRGKTWYIRYYINGKPHQESLKTKDKVVAKFKKNELENTLRKGQNPLPEGTISPQDILRQYTALGASKNHAKTVKDDESTIRKFIEWAPVFEIRAISRALVEDYLSSRIKEDKLSLYTANSILTTIKSFLNFAVARNYLLLNPAASIEPFKPDEPPRKALSGEQRDKVLLAANGETLYPAMATAFLAGPREAELKRLEWPQVDFRNKVIVILKTKSKRMRVVPLSKRLAEILKPFRKESGLCFSFTNQRRILKRISRTAGVYVNWKICRSTFGSLLVRDGVSLYKVAEWLGHTDVRVTKKHYAHLLPSYDADIERN